MIIPIFDLDLDMQSQQNFCKRNSHFAYRKCKERIIIRFNVSLDPTKFASEGQIKVEVKVISEKI